MTDDGLREDAVHDAANLSTVIAQIEAGELDARPPQRHYLADALAALEGIPAELEARGIKTAHGGDKWRASSIKSVPASATARRLPG